MFEVSQSSLYFHDYAYLKKMGDCYKLVKCNEVRRAGYQLCGTHTVQDGVWVGDMRHGRFLSRTSTYLDPAFSINENANARVHSNEEKLKNNITRARNKIIEYGLCNDFDYFCTFTLDKTKYDRRNLPEYVKHLGIFIQNFNARTAADIKFLLIPEQHKDGAWHLHGFMKGIPDSMLQLFDRKDKRKLPRFILDGLKDGRQLYDFPAYRDRFGYCCLEPVKNKIASTMYMCKYMTKEISGTVRELGSHLYYCSKGLNKAEVVAQGQWLDSDYNFDYVHKFGSISFYESLDSDTLDYIKDRIGGDPIVLEDRRRGFRTDSDGWNIYYDPDTGEIFGSEERMEVVTNVEIFNRHMPAAGKRVPDGKECSLSVKAVGPPVPEVSCPAPAPEQGYRQLNFLEEMEG